MAHRRAPLEGEPSGFRVHVPLQGMHLIHGVRNSGQVPLPSWADVDLPPSEWLPPAASFEEDTGRQRELNRLLAKLTQLPTHPDEGFPTVQSVADSAASAELADLDVSKLWPELEALETHAAQRQATLQRLRAHLLGVAHPPAPRGQRLRRDESSASLQAKAEEPPPPPPIQKPPPSSARYSGKGSQPPPREKVAPAKAPAAAPGSITAVRLKLSGAPTQTLRPSSTPVPGEGRGGTSGRSGGPASVEAAGAAAAAAAAAAAIAQKSVRAAQQAKQAQAKQAQREREAAREREELGEAAGYTSMRVKPASSINPKQFWTAVDEYMRPLPKQPPPRPPAPLPLPERTAITDRLLAALLPVPADAPPAPAPADSTNGGSSSVSAPAEQIEKRLRESLISIGLLRHEEMAAPLRPDGVGDELRKLQGQLEPLARQNAKELAQIHRRAQAASGAAQRERIELVEQQKEQYRAQKQRQLQQQANAPPKAHAKRRKGDHSSHAAAAAAPAQAKEPAAAAGAVPMDTTA